MENMEKTQKKLIPDFLVPALDSNLFNDLLYWADRDKQIFMIKWSHKNAARWNSEDTLVFQEWDKLKKRHKPHIPQYFMQAKQRFRAALQKLNNKVERLESQVKGYKCYKLLNPEEQKARKLKGKKQVKKPVKAIRTSVIRQNLSYSRNEASTSSSCSASNSSFSPCSPVSSQESDHSSGGEQSSSDIENIMQSYRSAQARHFASYQGQNDDTDETLSDEEMRDSDQKENVQSEIMREPPHVPNASGYDRLTVYDNFCTPRYESPKILLVKTHYESRPRPMGNYNIGCVLPEASPCALNLSIRQDVK